MPWHTWLVFLPPVKIMNDTGARFGPEVTEQTVNIYWGQKNEWSCCSLWGLKVNYPFFLFFFMKFLSFVWNKPWQPRIHSICPFTPTHILTDICYIIQLSLPKMNVNNKNNLKTFMQKGQLKFKSQTPLFSLSTKLFIIIFVLFVQFSEFSQA